MLACEKYNLVHEFFKKMQKSFIPNSLSYKGKSTGIMHSFLFILHDYILRIAPIKFRFLVLVNTFRKEGKVDEAIRTVKEMEERGIVGSAAIYYDLARCLCSEGRCKEALVQVNVIYMLMLYTITLFGFH